jgi:hypothetical protein
MAVNISKVRFGDLPEREKAAEEYLRDKWRKYKARIAQSKPLNKSDQKEFNRIDAIIKVLKGPELCDPLYLGVRELFNASPGILGMPLGNHTNGAFDRALIPPGRKPNPAIQREAITKVALVLGLLAADEVKTPLTIAGKAPVGGWDIIVDQKSAEFGDLSRAFFGAVGEEKDLHKLAMLVLPILGREGDPDDPGRGLPSTVKVREFAEVMRCLDSKDITADEPQLRRRVNECLDRIQSVGENKPLSDITIQLPNLDEDSDLNIQAENIKLMGPMICSAMLDELKAFQVVDKLVELFQAGTLPVGRGKAGEILYRYWKETPNRMSEAERQNFYAQTIGVPGGQANGAANREFNDLWLRFVSSVSTLVRQAQVDNMLRDRIPNAINQQQVRKAARDLAANLSLHGYGMSYFAAVELQKQIKQMIDLLGDRDIMAAYGARDMWQVIDQVAALELGGAKNSSRYRTLATCGGIITAWLSNNVKRISSPRFGAQMINLADLLIDPPDSAESKATERPTDFDLVNACELWLSDTATSDDRVMEFTQPRESPTQTSRPISIPSVAREFLEQAGVPGFGLGMGTVRH